MLILLLIIVNTGGLKAPTHTKYNYPLCKSMYILYIYIKNIIAGLPSHNAINDTITFGIKCKMASLTRVDTPTAINNEMRYLAIWLLYENRIVITPNWDAALMMRVDKNPQP